MSVSVPITACRACGNQTLIPVLDLGEHALAGRFPRQDQPDPPKGRLALMLCDVSAGPNCCGLLQLADAVSDYEMFGVNYGYRSSITRTMVSHLANHARRAIELAQPKPGDWVLDIGSNDGTLLQQFAGRGLSLIGVDPSAGRYRDQYPAGARLVVDFFSPKNVLAAAPDARCQIVMSIAMFYDLNDPLPFMTGIRDLLAPDGIWVSEQSYEPAFFSNLCYDAVCHEHVSYFSLKQMEWLAQRAGLKILDAEENASNGGHFTVTFCLATSSRAPNDEHIGELRRLESQLRLDRPESWSGFARRVAEHRNCMAEFFADCRARNELVLGYGASTKGNVVLQYCGLTPSDLPAIAERDPSKYGLVTPGSRIPIISESEARARNPSYFLVLPWHFRDEITARESSFLSQGGQLLFHLPKFDVVRWDDVKAAPAARTIAAQQ